MKITLIIITTLTLTSCTHFQNQRLKSPCDGERASLSTNPCHELPINIG